MKNSSDYHSKESENQSIKNKKVKKNSKENKWIYYIFLITFMLSIGFSTISNLLIDKLNIVVATVLLFIIIAIGILFDMIGMAVISASEKSFHAKAAKKQVGAKETVKLVKYQEKVSSVCNDVVGDVCGVASGALSAMLAIKFANVFHLDTSIVTIIFSAVVASITVGGKAIEKSIVMKHSDQVIFAVGKVIHYTSINNILKKYKKSKNNNDSKSR